ncbi:hypothetical protein EMIHUDRAFT_117909 [Emiliania huxleyi CCMP1516]|uniref:TFIIS N-terminal domain-containing protein n=2 Tax=Emiliania huxleyi TaxID=2903 RepID=A0A0D3J853_EMIH1|nr:hypothetical protein EMIHUDRAFT_117909 [Emiliania huxleyi CCMP1516]EOD19688.1 hypothetical protein EMIHUDRAFT_117909 [Emiliania huxleyi CCMP1516]|eukprot:XP_005772117.1 hypothetical protein EMIHUDRAFT_117909 [Emiliania huxleyi CCMP1516]
MEEAPPAEPAEEPAPAADEPAPAAAEPEPEAAAEEEETEESKKRSLHAAIFGDDSDSDGDDNLPSLAHPESEKVKRVLGKGKASSKKDKGKPDGAPRKRLKKADEGSSSAADAAAAAGEADEGAQGVVDGGFAEEGVEGAAAPDSDDDDSESDGPGGVVALLPEVVTMLNKRHMQEEVLIDQGMLTTLAMWLKPIPGEERGGRDGSLVSLQVRTDLLRVLGLLEVDETVLGSLRSSSLGKYVRLYSLHKKETAANRHTATALAENVPQRRGQTAEDLERKAMARVEEERGRREGSSASPAAVRRVSAGGG